MVENKRKITWRMLVPELLSVFVCAAGICAVSFIRQKSTEEMVSIMILGIIGVLILGFQVRQAYLDKELEYDNGEHYHRFWICFMMGLAGAFVCAFLPAAGWPFMPIFVLLSLFGNMNIGILGASVLLTVSVGMSNAAMSVFVLYFLSGVFAISLFRHLNDSFKIGSKIFLALLCQLLGETAVVILLANERLSVELFVIPMANIVISGIVLLGILKLFFSMVIFKYRLKYLELNDTENAVLADLRTSSKSEYMHSVHTAYFCERIAAKLSMDVEALKCAGYYHKVSEARPELASEQDFPPAVREILAEYHSKKPVIRRETAVLLCSDKMMNTIQYLISKSEDKGLNYDYIIDNVFQHFEDTGAFFQCDITLKELKTMQNIFKEEKLYYDFLR